MLNTRYLGRTITSIGLPKFGGAFFDLVNSTARIDSCVAFAFGAANKPTPVLAEGACEKSAIRASECARSYAEKSFASANVARDLKRVSEFELHIAGEARWRGRELVLLACHKRTLFLVWLSRQLGQPAFNERDQTSVTQIADLLLSALKRHCDLRLLNPDHAPDAGATNNEVNVQRIDHLAAVLIADNSRLSPRESQVCAAIILGYRTLAISLQLGLSENTICTHRKRAYAKLGVCSQNELFSRYFQAMTRLDSALATKRTSSTQAALSPA